VQPTSPACQIKDRGPRIGSSGCDRNLQLKSTGKSHLKATTREVRYRRDYSILRGLRKGGAMSELAKVWSGIAGKFKELNTPLFKQKGDVGKFAQQYDAANDAKEKLQEKKKGLFDIISKAADKVNDVGKKIDAATDELKTVQDDAQKDLESSNTTLGADAEPDDVIKRYTTLVSVQTNYYKEKKGIYDQVAKLDDQYVSAMKGGVDEYKKQWATIKSGLDKIEQDKRRLENSIRAAVADQTVIAMKMNRKDIADQARSITGSFDPP
jgi:predicted  nucleic acid-binding Zn-ribbon protein